MEVSKVCSKCKMVKTLNEFYKDSSQKSGYYPSCRTCKHNTVKELAQKYSLLAGRETKEKKVCSQCKKEKNVSEYSKNRCHKDGLDNVCKHCKRIYNCAYTKTRAQYDPEFKLHSNLRCRLGRALRGKSKTQTTRQLIGLDFEMFTKWIEYQLEEGMTMQNYGSVWQLDHVLPISSFNLLDEEELQKAMNWKNIRPLLPLRNIQKSNKIDRWLYVMQEVKAYYFLK